MNINELCKKAHENAKGMYFEMQLAKIYSTLALLGAREWPNISISKDYAAGLFDGEGHVGVCRYVREKGRIQYITRVQIAIKQKELLEPFTYFGGHVIRVDASRWNKNARAIHKWTIHNREAQKFLLAILPSLKNGDKIYSAKCALEMEFLRKHAGKNGNVFDITRVPKQELLYREIIKTNSGRNNFNQIEQEKELEELTILYQGNNLRSLNKTPENVIADTLIRIFDTCAHYGIDLEQAIDLKMKYNEGREFKHGKVI